METEKNIAFAKMLLESEGYTVTPPPPPIIYPKCNFCDTTSEDDYFCSVEVITNEGEEGYDHRTVLFCEAHTNKLIEVLDAIKQYGFSTHHHGSTDFLEDTECPGARGGNCPSPENSPYDRQDPGL